MNKHKDPQPQRIILNDSTRAFLAGQGTAAEQVFQTTRNDKPLSVSDAQWRNLLSKLSQSCRKTAGLFAKYREIVENANEKQELRLTVSEREKLRQTIEFASPGELILTSLHAFWKEAEQSVGGLDNGLKLFAQYFDSMTKRRSGRRRDLALTLLITGKLIAFVSQHGDRTIVHWSTTRQRYEGAFLDEMKRTLQRLNYKYGSSDALAQRIEAAKKRIIFTPHLSRQSKKGPA